MLAEEKKKPRLTQILQCRITNQELLIFDKEAERRGITRSELIRQFVAGGLAENNFKMSYKSAGELGSMF